MFHKIFKSNFIRSGIIFSIANFIVSIIGYVINLLIARSFSLAHYGEYMTAMSYLLFMFVPINTFGFIIVQRIGREKKEDRKSLSLDLEKWLVSEIKAHAPILVLLAAIFAVLVYFKGNLGLPAIIFILATTLLTAFQTLYSGSLQAFKQFFLAGLLLVIIFSMRLVFSVGVIFTNPDLIAIFFAFVFSTLVGLGVGRKMISIDATVSEKEISHTFLNVVHYLKRKKLFLTLITTLGIIGLANIDIILVKKFLPADQAGLYSSISLLGKIILYVATPLSQVAFSFFTGSDSKHNSLLILMILSLAYLFIGTVSTVAYFFFPELVIGIIFGSKFLSISNLIWMAAIFGTLYSLVALYSQFFISKNSWWGLATFTALCVQTVILFFNHTNLQQVLEINIAVCFILLTVLVGRVALADLKRL